MKTELKIKTFIAVILITLIGIPAYANNAKLNKNSNDLLLANNILEETNSEVMEVALANDENKEEIVYDGLTRQELIDKLNRNLNSTLSGKGEVFADHSLELGLDPYLAVAIVLHETGCSWECSSLVKYCNNVGGQKGSPSCGGGSYAAFATLDEGIYNYLDNLYYNYYALGLTTPETINTRYASSTAWSGKINYYIEKIKAN